MTGTLVSDADSYHIALMPGWNVIGNPWQSSINWDDSRISVSDGIQMKSLHDAALPPNPWIEGNLYAIDPATEAYSVMPENAVPPNRIFAWQGYLLFSFIQGEMIISIPPADTAPPIAQISSPANDAKICAYAKLSIGA